MGTAPLESQEVLSASPVSNGQSSSVNRTIGLIGNPNVGKTTLFNRLTGMRQRVGNYPGVTVEKKEGTVFLPSGSARLFDLPGAYSLAAASPDERVVLDALCGALPGEPVYDLVLCVVDVCNLQRNLFLATQVADLGYPLVIALNCWDELEGKGLSVDAQLLGERLGVPCVPVSAARNWNIENLLKAMEEALLSKPRLRTRIWPEAVVKGVEELRCFLPLSAANLRDAECRRLLFDVDSSIATRLGWDRETKRQHLEKARKHLFDAGMNPLAAEALLQYEHLGKCLEGVTTSAPHPARHNRSESIDRILMHRGWGLVVFVAMMWVVFQSVYSWAGPLMDVIEGLISLCQDFAGLHLESTPLLQSLVRDGVIAGVGAFLIFLPQILVLFFFIALLEDSGYMARAAFLMDKLFSWCGLNGKSFVPMLSSYACAVPAIMAVRTIDNPKARLATILVAPLMSCSARLPVYVLLIGAFIEPVYGAFWAGFTLLAMHFVGLFVALPVAWFLNRFLLKTPPQPFLLEMPPYRAPRLNDVLFRMYQRGKDFVQTAGTIIFAMTIVVWALLYFPRPESIAVQTRDTFVSEYAHNKALEPEKIRTALESGDDPFAVALRKELDLATETAYTEQSFLGRFGHFAQPLFHPAGFDWRITVGIISSFPAREVIISTLGILYRLGTEVDEENDDLRDVMTAQVWRDGPRLGQPVYTIPTVLALMVFFALCQQCGSTLAVTAREAGTRWAVFSWIYMTALAWLFAVATYQFFSLLL